MKDRYKDNKLTDEVNEVLTESLKLLESKGYIKKIWNEELQDFEFVPIKRDFVESDFNDLL